MKITFRSVHEHKIPSARYVAGARALARVHGDMKAGVTGLQDLLELERRRSRSQPSLVPPSEKKAGKMVTSRPAGANRFFFSNFHERMNQETGVFCEVGLNYRKITGTKRSRIPFFRQTNILSWNCPSAWDKSLLWLKCNLSVYTEDACILIRCLFQGFNTTIDLLSIQNTHLKRVHSPKTALCPF